MAGVLKSLALIGVGAAAGGLLASHLVEQQASFSLRASDDAPSLLETVTQFVRGHSADAQRPASVTEHLTAYAAAGAQTDLASLQQALRDVAATAASPERDLEIDAVLARVAELAPLQAVAWSRQLELDPPFIVAAYVLLAESDPQSAIAELSRIQSPMLRREVALALLEALPDEPTLADQIAGSFPAYDRGALTLHRLSWQAKSEPATAFREAAAMADASLRDEALVAVAETWARQDPYGALGQADGLGDANTSRRLRSIIYATWAEADPGAFASYLESGAGFQDEMISGVQYLAASDPERLVRIAGGVGGMLGPQVAALAYGALAERDPAAAQARVAALAPGQSRDTAIQAVGSALARIDPDAALDWARNLSPPAPNALQSIVLTVATTHPQRAIEMLDSPELGAQSSLLFAVVTSTLVREPEQAARLANQLAARDDIQSVSMLQNLVGSWVREDPEPALDWILRNGASVDAAAISGAAQSMASVDPQAAAAWLERVPSQHRDTWITQVAGPYGRYDPTGAATWLAQFQGQPVYDRAMRDVIVSASQSDPRLAADLLTRVVPDVQRTTAGRITSLWVQQEPAAAMDWAGSLGDEQARSVALVSGVSQWANSDFSAARRWALAQRSSETRDQALLLLVQQAAGKGNFDRDLIDAIGSEPQRRASLQAAITQLSRTDPEQARELLDSDIVDTNTRRGIEAQIERLSQVEAGIQLR